MPPPQRAEPARKSARCGVGDGSPRLHPPHPHPVGSGPLPHARTDERSGLGERPSPDAPHPGKRRPPWATSCRPHSTQERALWARTNCTRDTVGGQSGEGECLTSDAPHNAGRHPPRGCPSATPKASNAGPQGRRLWGLCWVPTPPPTAPGTQGSRNPSCPSSEDGRPGEGQRLTPDAPHNSGGPPPPGTAPHQPRGKQLPQGMQAKGTVLGPHTHTSAPAARG